MASLNLQPFSQVVEQYMLDSLTIVRPGEPTIDPETLLQTIPETEVYTGKGFVTPEGTPYATTTGGAQLADARFNVGIPKGTDPVLPNDLITVDASPNNPGMVGMELIVIGQVEGTFSVYRQLSCFRKQDAS